MKLLRLSLCAAMAISLIAGCSSSSTTGGSTPQTSGARTEKSPDDEARELMLQIKTMSDKERKEKGRAIAMRIMELRSQASPQTQKEIDWMMTAVTETRSESSQAGAAQSESLPTASRVKSTAAPMNEDPSTIGGPEQLPQPREVK